jgi:Alpha/beta hydrolase domain
MYFATLAARCGSTSGGDIAMPDEVRVYTVSGVPHAPFRPLTKPVMQLPGNRLGYGAFMRALLVALFEWVEHGTAPPDSRFPSRAAGTRWCRSQRPAGHSPGCRK